jgi:RimJ/RimL family protein N-acetyltransferase
VVSLIENASMSDADVGIRSAHVTLRGVVTTDLDVLFEHQLDPEANLMAAFTARDPTDREAFDAKWRRILDDEQITVRAVLANGELVGSIGCWTDAELGRVEVTYWLGREHWGRGIATQALALFLELVGDRPIHGRAATDNTASRRVLEKCGFTICGASRGFANARGSEIDEVTYELR